MSSSAYFEVVLDPEHGPTVRCSDPETADEFDDYLVKTLSEGEVDNMSIRFEDTVSLFYLGRDFPPDRARELVSRFLAPT